MESWQLIEEQVTRALKQYPSNDEAELAYTVATQIHSGRLCTVLTWIRVNTVPQTLLFELEQNCKVKAVTEIYAKGPTSQLTLYVPLSVTAKRTLCNRLLLGTLVLALVLVVIHGYRNAAELSQTL